jgi:hypothetical protein
MQPEAVLRNGGPNSRDLADTAPDAFGNYVRDQTPTSRKRNKSAPNRIDQGALFELAVFAAPAVEPDSHWTAIKRRLTPNAGPDSGKHTAARFRDFITAFQAMGLSLTNRHARPRSQDPVYHGIVDLILHRPVPGPPARHSRFPVSFSRSSHRTQRCSFQGWRAPRRSGAFVAESCQATFCEIELETDTSPSFDFRP